MLTPKQKQSIDFVCEVFEVFFQKAYHQSSLIHADDALPVAAKLTQVYFDNHYHDGTSK